MSHGCLQSGQVGLLDCLTWLIQEVHHSCPQHSMCWAFWGPIKSRQMTQVNAFRIAPLSSKFPSWPEPDVDGVRSRLNSGIMLCWPGVLSGADNALTHVGQLVDSVFFRLKSCSWLIFCGRSSMFSSILQRFSSTSCSQFCSTRPCR